jgi:hypothetical protein
MSTLREDLALERVALVELETEATALWQNRQYTQARRRQAEAERARERIRELESRETAMGRFDSYREEQERA